MGPSPMISVLIGVIVAIIAFIAGYIVRKSSAEKAIGSAEQQAKNILLDAESKSDTIRKEIEIEAKEEAHKMRSDVEKKSATDVTKYSVRKRDLSRRKSL